MQKTKVKYIHVSLQIHIFHMITPFLYNLYDSQKQPATLITVLNFPEIN